MKSKSLDYQVLSEIFDLDSSVESGLRWKRRPRHHFDSDKGWKIFNTSRAGNEAGADYIDKFGIRRHIVRVKSIGFTTQTARIVWCITNKADPKNAIVDHINRNPCDNRPENLRLVNPVQSSINCGIRSDNKSGHSGVWYDKSRSAWIAKAWSSGKTIFIGRFQHKEEAVLARADKEKEVYGEFLPQNKTKQTQCK